MGASHTALSVTSTGVWQWFSLFAGLPLLGQPSFRAGLPPERILPPCANSTEEWGGGCSQRIYFSAGIQEAWARFLQGSRHCPSSLLFIGCFGTISKGRKAASTQTLTSLVISTTVVANVPKPNFSPSVFFPWRDILRQPLILTPAILSP